MGMDPAISGKSIDLRGVRSLGKVRSLNAQWGNSHVTKSLHNAMQMRGRVEVTPAESRSQSEVRNSDQRAVTERHGNFRDFFPARYDHEQTDGADDEHKHALKLQSEPSNQD